MTKKELNECIKEYDAGKDGWKIEITYPFSLANRNRLFKDVKYLEEKGFAVISSDTGGIIGLVAFRKSDARRK